jgi:hypothetical protein
MRLTPSIRDFRSAVIRANIGGSDVLAPLKGLLPIFFSKLFLAGKQSSLLEPETKENFFLSTTSRYYCQDFFRSKTTS